MARRWTPEDRARQSTLVSNRKSWERSIGAKIEAGKAKTSRNAYKDGFRKRLSELRQQFWELEKNHQEIFYGRR